MFNRKLIKHQQTIIEVLTKRVEVLSSQRVTPVHSQETGEVKNLYDRIAFLRNVIERAIENPSANLPSRLQHALDIDAGTARDTKVG